MNKQAVSLDRLIIELDGDFWGTDALSLAERLPLSNLAGAKRVILSLQKVSGIDQAGLAMLVRLYSQLRVRGSELELVHVPQVVLELLERVGFSRVVSASGAADSAEIHYTVNFGASIKA